jgi:Multiubiquitin
MSEHEVRIHIDRQPYESPDPTTGAALYILGKISGHRELFREVDGDHEDELVPNDAASVRLKKDEHFYSERDFHIIVNARQKVVTQKVLSFAQIVALAFDNPPTAPNLMFTVTYRNVPRQNPEGSLLEGQSVKIKDKMVFNVTPTDKS